MDSSNRIDREEVQRLVRDGNAQLVEVLPRSAFEALHLPAAISLPLTELDEESAGRIDRNHPVIVYCYDHQ